MFTEYRPAEGEVATTPQMWAENFRGSAGYTLKARLGILLDSRWALVRRYFRPGDRVLDAGCGFGEWVEFLCRRGFDAEGLDYSDELVGRLRASYPSRTWTQGSTQATPYADATFDGLISWGVIEHDPEGPDRQLREFLRILKPGGRALVTVPYDSQPMRMASSLQFPGPGGKFFQFFYTPEELSRLVSAAGFRLLECAPSPEVHVALVTPRLYARTRGNSALFRSLRNVYRILTFLPGPTGMIYAMCEKSPS